MTEETTSSWRATVNRLALATTEATTTPVPEEDTADYAGHINAASTKLARHKRSMMSEVGGFQSGQEYEIYQSRITKRSYNFDRILADVRKEADRSAIDAIRLLIDRGALKVEFGWTALEALFTSLHLPMVVQKGNPVEGGDLTGPHVGEIVEVKARLGARREDSA